MKKSFALCIIVCSMMSCITGRKAEAPNSNRISTENGYIAIYLSEYDAQAVRLSTIEKNFVRNNFLGKKPFSNEEDYFLINMPIGDHYFATFLNSEYVSENYSETHFFAPPIFDTKLKISVKPGTITYIGDFIIEVDKYQERGNQTTRSYSYNLENATEGLKERYGNIINNFKIEGHFDEATVKLFIEEDSE
ncbi:MAG: hypothetical protein JXR63_02300 [Spirochaetales bacterium]|nr:hypothetical protein [Spirochaetales bacterium]